MTSINFEHKIIYYHCHKTGGSFIQENLWTDFSFVTYNFLVLDDLKRFYLDRNEGIFMKVKKALCDEKLIICDYDQFKHFSFVRNPYTRFISGWKYVYGELYKKNPIPNDINIVIENKNTYSDLVYTHIFMTQYDMLKDSNGNISLDFIGRYENLIPDLKNYLGRFFSKEDVDVIEDVKINENPIKYGDYRQYYTQNILDFVNSNFDKDFEVFGYSKILKIEDMI